MAMTVAIKRAVRSSATISPTFGQVANRRDRPLQGGGPDLSAPNLDTTSS
jgi:hypothetical protein